MAKHVLHVMQASMQFSDSFEQFDEDMAYIIKQQPDIVGFSEVTASDDLTPRMARIARDNDYVPVIFPKGGCQFMIKPGDNLRLKSRSYTKVHDGDTDSEGRYGPRAVTAIRVKFHDIGVWVHEAHWVARSLNTQKRLARFNLMTKTMGTQVRLHGKGENVSLWMGDLNSDPDRSNYPREQFRQQGLVTVFDDFKVEPNTHDASTLDYIGRFAPDKNLTFTRYKVHPKQNTDHRMVSAWAEIETKKKKPKPTEPTPGDTSGEQEDDDPYATGGNVSWKDYQDNTVYKYPQATDDSDLTNG